MRGAKLIAWRIPPIWKALRENKFVVPEGSIVPKNQAKMLKVTEEVLNAIAKDVRRGLLETVGIESDFSNEDEKCSMALSFASGTDVQMLARAIDAENIEAWTDEKDRVHIALNPWYSTKDIDQTVLCTIKVIHVLLGIHASDNNAPRTLKQKLLSSVREILEIQKGAKK